jgi:aldehyde dehydrogenase (NAD+)
MMEQWHPLGPIGVITSFNFPVAVWAWNTALALVYGDTVIWKPSEKTPLTALAVQASVAHAMEKFGYAPRGISIFRPILQSSNLRSNWVSDARVCIGSTCRNYQHQIFARAWQHPRL